MAIKTRSIIDKFLIILPFILGSCINENNSGALQIATLKGFVFDNKLKEGIPAVKITLAADSLPIYTTYSNELGYFKFDSVNYGIYNLKAYFILYNTKQISNINIDSNVVFLDIEMNIGLGDSIKLNSFHIDSNGYHGKTIVIKGSDIK